VLPVPGSQEACVLAWMPRINGFVSSLPATFMVLHDVMSHLPVNPSNVYLIDAYSTRQLSAASYYGSPELLG